LKKDATFFNLNEVRPATPQHADSGMLASELLHVEHYVKPPKYPLRKPLTHKKNPQTR